ncbi:hypothetical protein [Providencia rustigianii]|uniref:hypothetical protein n=1 Tax=Providencia rustigianii TaxID=158850 RepID=UPI00223FAC13|nr:hypothetical protein [Providencia rustigianii]
MLSGEICVTQFPDNPQPSRGHGILGQAADSVWCLNNKQEDLCSKKADRPQQPQGGNCWVITNSRVSK